MIRKGTRVELLSKKVGQIPATGKVVAMRDGHAVEVEWDAAHTSIISKSAVTPITEATRPHKGVREPATPPPDAGGREAAEHDGDQAGTHPHQRPPSANRVRKDSSPWGRTTGTDQGLPRPRGRVTNGPVGRARPARAGRVRPPRVLARTSREVPDRVDQERRARARPVPGIDLDRRMRARSRQPGRPLPQGRRSSTQRRLAASRRNAGRTPRSADET